jgi:hypothetical protein
MPHRGADVENLVCSEQFPDFDDGFVDSRVREAASDQDPVIAALANAIVERKAPKLIAEVTGLEERRTRHNQAAMFRQDCKHHVPDLARKFGIPIGQFLVCGPKPVKFEERSSHFDIQEARNLKPEEREELIMVFWNGETEPRSIVDVPNGVAAYCSQRVFGINRLYVVDSSNEAESRVQEMRKEVKGWASI